MFTFFGYFLQKFAVLILPKGARSALLPAFPSPEKAARYFLAPVK